MDEQLKKKIYWSIIFVSLLVLVYGVWGYISFNKKMQEDAIAVDRSPLTNFRLLAIHTNDVVTIDVVNADSGEKYEGIFLSETCPLAEKNKPGLIMKLSVVEYFKPATNEKFYRFDRAYDYLCTKKDMQAEDEALLKAIMDARQRQIQELPVLPPAQPSGQ